jgi:hypothetical protein
MKRNERSRWKHLTILLLTSVIALYASGAYAENIDPDNAGCKYAWAENVGWINFKPLLGPGVTVTDSAVNGMAWAENTGWINLSPTSGKGGVMNNGMGTLSGYAWGENVGWINFAPSGGGVTICSDGMFSGYAWGENIGWIKFSTAHSCLKTSWVTSPQTYSFYGFLSPVDNLPIINATKAGQTIPVKWQLVDSNGVPISNPDSFKSLTSKLVGCASLADAPIEVVEEYAADSSGLQYLGDGNWQFNWKTPKTYATQCRVMILTLGDGSMHSASFKFK